MANDPLSQLIDWRLDPFDISPDNHCKDQNHKDDDTYSPPCPIPVTSLPSSERLFGPDSIITSFFHYSTFHKMESPSKKTFSATNNPAFWGGKTPANPK